MLLAHTVLVSELSLENVRKDLHIAMTVRAKSLARGHAVIVQDAQRPEAHVLRIGVPAK
jgi:hypothetical protein